MNKSEFFHHLDFIQKELFPRSYLVFLTRDAKDVVASRKRARFKDNTTEEVLNHFFKIVMPLASNRSKERFILDYSDLVSDSPRLRELFEFVGEPFNEEAINNVLSKPHSYLGIHQVFKEGIK